MLGYTFQTGDSGDKPRSQEESKKEVSSKGNQSCYEEGASALIQRPLNNIVYIESACFCVLVFQSVCFFNCNQYGSNMLNWVIQYVGIVLNWVIQYVRISIGFSCNQYDKNILNWPFQYVRISMFFFFISMIKHTELTDSVCLNQYVCIFNSVYLNILNWKTYWIGKN